MLLLAHQMSHGSATFSCSRPAPVEALLNCHACLASWTRCCFRRHPALVSSLQVCRAEVGLPSTEQYLCGAGGSHCAGRKKLRQDNHQKLVCTTRGSSYLGLPCFRVLLIRALLRGRRVLIQGPLLSETPKLDPGEDFTCLPLEHISLWPASVVIVSRIPHSPYSYHIQPLSPDACHILSNLP